MSENNTGVTVTLKAGVGFEVPWIVIHAESVDDALRQIDSGPFATLAERTVAAAEFFRAAHNVKTGLAANSAPAQAAPAQQGWNTSAQAAPPAFVPQAQPQQAYAQAATQQAPPVQQGAGETCIHGAMKYKESAPGAAKTWKAWMCPTPKGTAGQCEPIWLRG
jgi:hypothetical protein